MRVLFITAHPVETSFNAAVHAAALRAMREAGHEVDHCDLYAEGFDPVLSREARLVYHDPARNRAGVEGYVARLQAAEALVLGFPVWCFNVPAILKGWFDRLILPGVAFELEGGRVTPTLRHIRAVAGIATYGRPRYMAWWIGDPPRRIVTRYLRWFVRPGAPITYLAHYHMNVSTDATRARFIARVERAMRRFGA